MKEIGKILAYLFLTVVLGALIAPALFWLGQLALSYAADYGFVTFQNNGGRMDVNGSLSFLASPFQRYFNRAILIAAILLVWPLVRSLGIRSRNALGLWRDPFPMRRLSFGFCVAAGSLVLMGITLLLLDIYHLRSSPRWIELATLPLTAIVVSFIEESLFRGAMQGAVQRTAADYVAMIFVSGLFAIVHFLKPQDQALSVDEVTWATGLLLVPLAFWQFSEPQLVLGGFTTLFLVGMILSYARLRTHSLWLPIGLHAGWIVGKMSFSKITKRTDDAWPWFGPDLLVGLGPVIVVLLTGCVVWWWLNHVDPYARANRY